jgi:glucose-6-phosphate dehydrogenase assembly protein OpcA
MYGAGDRFSDDPDFETMMELESIEQQIAQLWHPDSAGDEPLSSVATRAAVLNLISYAPNVETARRFHLVTERLSQVHPCRVVLFRRESTKTSGSASPEIHATCPADGGEAETPCIERIEIPVTRPMYRQIASLSQPLIIPELPAFLWWPAAPLVSDTAFMDLARTCNITIIDSHKFESTHELTHLAELGSRLRSRAAIADLNWQRLKPWRELTAQFFDIRSVNWALGCIREVEIDAGPTKSNALPAQAIMLGSWLAHCLSWAPHEARRTRKDRWAIELHDQHGEHVRIIIRTRPSAEEWSGHVLAMSMTARSEERDPSMLSISRSRGSSLIRMNAREGTKSALHHAVYHPLLPDEALLVPVLESTDRDHVFESSLERAVETIDLLGKPEVE